MLSRIPNTYLTIFFLGVTHSVTIYLPFVPGSYENGTKLPHYVYPACYSRAFHLSRCYSIENRHDGAATCRYCVEIKPLAPSLGQNRLIIQKAVGFMVSNWIYNGFFHPLASLPGPFLYGASGLPLRWHQVIGQEPFILAKLHHKYGYIVRIAPNDISYTNSESWSAIYGRHPSHEGAHCKFTPITPFHFKVETVASIHPRN